jgi:thiamine-monophosphate kinase
MSSEFEFIEHLSEIFHLGKIGDDCAIIEKDENTELVITTDLLVEDIDFCLKWSTPQQVGHKALAVSISDVAAMGARPLYALTSIAVPENLWKTDFTEEFYNGFMSLAAKFSIELIGGDISRSNHGFSVNSILLGEIEKGHAIFRSGAQVGDLIYVTGFLGDAAAGLKLLQGDLDSKCESESKILISRHLKPEPQLAIGVTLAKNRLATAMIDISDGLSSEIWHICRSSRVGARIIADNIPLSKELQAIIQDERERLSLALNGGEDFQLLFTVSPQKVAEMELLLCDQQITLIGEITDNKTVEIVFDDRVENLYPRGFQHF